MGTTAATLCENPRSKDLNPSLALKTVRNKCLHPDFKKRKNTFLIMFRPRVATIPMMKAREIHRLRRDSRASTQPPSKWRPLPSRRPTSASDASDEADPVSATTSSAVLVERNVAKDAEHRRIASTNLADDHLRPSTEILSRQESVERSPTRSKGRYSR